jgi:Protein of unknown function (DUF5818)
MSKTLMFAFVLLVSAFWLQAQQYPSPGSSQTGGKASGQNKVVGCVQGSDGSFTLTDSSGTTYQLQGDTAKLTEHVGHEVQISGNMAESSAPAANASAAGAGSQPTLEVKSVKHLSKTCKSASK